MQAKVAFVTYTETLTVDGQFCFNLYLLLQFTSQVACTVSHHACNQLMQLTVRHSFACCHSQQILQPDVPHSLRLQGILIGGVVVLFSKQQVYLLGEQYLMSCAFIQYRCTCTRCVYVG